MMPGTLERRAYMDPERLAKRLRLKTGDAASDRTRAVVNCLLSAHQ